MKLHFNRMPFGSGFGAAAACLLVASASVSAQPQYQVVDLGTLGGNMSGANGISEAGIVAGWAQIPSSRRHGAIWDQSGIVDLGEPPGLVVTEAAAVNDAGQVAAFARDGDGSIYQSYLWENGAWLPVGVLPGLTDTTVSDIDPNGRIVGRSFIPGPGDPDRGFIWDTGTFTELGTLGVSSQAYAINNLMQVAGLAYLDLGGGGVGARAFLWQNGVMENLGVLSGEDASQAFGINERGDVVGSSWHVTSPSFFSAHQATMWLAGAESAIDLGLTPAPPAGTCVDQFPFWTANIARAVNNCGQVVGDAMCITSGASKAGFLWEDGAHYNLNDLIPAGSGLDLVSARDINDAGQIVGLAVNANNALRAYLLEPLTPPLCVILGDLDADRDVDAEDQLLFISVLLGQSADPDHVSRADFNGDAIADGADIAGMVNALLGT